MHKHAVSEPDITEDELLDAAADILFDIFNEGLKNESEREN